MPHPNTREEQVGSTLQFHTLRIHTVCNSRYCWIRRDYASGGYSHFIGGACHQGELNKYTPGTNLQHFTTFFKINVIQNIVIAV